MSTSASKHNTSPWLVIVVILVGILSFITFVILSPNNTPPPKSGNYPPIKGAFGFNLGDTLPESFKTETNDDRYGGMGIICRFPAPADLGLETDNPTPCKLLLTEDHRIADIEVSSDENEHFNLTNLKKILEDKYGPGETKSENDKITFEIWQKKTSVMLSHSIWGSRTNLYLCYSDDGLSDLTYNEQKKRQALLKEQQTEHQEQIQKQMQEDLKGKL